MQIIKHLYYIAVLGKETRVVLGDRCIGSGWDGVNFPYNSFYSAVLCICGLKSIDKVLMFLLLSILCTKSWLSLKPPSIPLF